VLSRMEATGCTMEQASRRRARSPASRARRM
jgi:hypothetical protein